MIFFESLEEPAYFTIYWDKSKFEIRWTISGKQLEFPLLKIKQEVSQNNEKSRVALNFQSNQLGIGWNGQDMRPVLNGDTVS